MDTKTNTAPLIDDLGRVMAEMENLALRERALKREIAALGSGIHEGEAFRVTVSTTARSTLDLKAVREKLSRQWIKAHTKERFVTAVAVTARTETGALS